VQEGLEGLWGERSEEFYISREPEGEQSFQTPRTGDVGSQANSF
jgi:hypothetical protein